jgi:hypothetical protein
MYLILKMMTRCAPQWTGKYRPLVTDVPVEVQTSGELLITLRGSIEIYSSNQ